MHSSSEFCLLSYLQKRRGTDAHRDNNLHRPWQSLSSGPGHSLYLLQIETGDEDDESESSDSESNDTLDLSKITEMRLVPSELTRLDTLFDVFYECAELNPEPIEEEEEHNWIFSSDQMEAEGTGSPV